MDGRVDERMLDAAEVGAALAAHGFGIERPAAGAVVLALNDPLRVVWANAAATRLFGTRDATGLYQQVFAGRGRDGLAAAVQRLVPGGGTRTERLRLFRGFRTRTLNVSISRAQMSDGDDVVVLAVPTVEDASPFAVSDLLAVAAQRVDGGAPAPAVAVIPARSPSRPVPQGSKRFLWQTDAEDRLVGLTDAVPDLVGLTDAMADPVGLGEAVPDPVGQGAGGAVGQSFFSALAAAGVDPDGHLARAAAGRASWSGLRVAWPLAHGGGHVPVVLGAMPIKGAGGGFEGFRGFGVADFTKLVVPPGDEAAADVADATDASPPVDGSPPPPGIAPAPGDAAPANGTTEAAATEADPAATAPAPMPDDAAAALAADAATPDDAADPSPGRPRAAEGREGFASGNVVALRPFQLLNNITALPPVDPMAPPARRRDDATRDRPPMEPANLSSIEQSNFDEIARALRGPSDERPSAVVAADADSHAAVLAALPVAVLIGCGGRLVYANDAFAALTGYGTVDALETAGGLDHLLGGLGPTHVAEATGDRAFPIIDAGGRVVAVEGRATTQAWSGLPALVLTLRPAADRVAQVQALEFDLRRRETEAAEGRALLDLADAAAVVDAQGRLLMLNSAGETLFGIHQNGVVGEPVGALLTPESQNAALGAVLAAAAQQPPGTTRELGREAARETQVTVSGRRPAGGVIPLRMSLRALAPGRVGIVFRDQSRLDALQRDLNHLRAERQSGASLSDVLAKVNLEIRTPLNAILGFAEIMLDERFGPIGNPRYKDYLTDIRAAGSHVVDVVGDLLDLSKTQSGQVEMKVTATDVNRVVSEAVAEMQGHASRDRVIMRLSLLPHLPNALVDDAAMRQVMSNILSNAIRYNEPGGQVIVSTALNEMKAITVRVRDTGIGMSEQEIAAAMEPFRPVGTDKPGGAAGLGLPLTRALVEANLATMAIKSRKNEGTLVEIVLRPSLESMSVPAA